MAINSIIVWLRAFEHLRVFPFMGYMVRYERALIIQSANEGGGPQALRDQEIYAEFGHRDLEAEKEGNAGYFVQIETYRICLSAECWQLQCRPS